MFLIVAALKMSVRIRVARVTQLATTRILLFLHKHKFSDSAEWLMGKDSPKSLSRPWLHNMESCDDNIIVVACTSQPDFLGKNLKFMSPVSTVFHTVETGSIVRKFNWTKLTHSRK